MAFRPCSLYCLLTITIFSVIRNDSFIHTIAVFAKCGHSDETRDAGDPAFAISFFNDTDGIRLARRRAVIVVALTLALV
jgi:hypothetical protein